MSSIYSANCLDDVLGGNAKRFEQFVGLSRMRHSRDGQFRVLFGAAAGLGERGKNRFAETTLGIMILDSDQISARGLQLPGELLSINGFHTVQIHHARGNSL